MHTAADVQTNTTHLWYSYGRDSHSACVPTGGVRDRQDISAPMRPAFFMMRGKIKTKYLKHFVYLLVKIVTKNIF